MITSAKKNPQGSNAAPAVGPLEDEFCGRVRRHAARRISRRLGVEPAERSKMLAEFMRLENEMLRRYHRRTTSGRKVAAARAVILDVLIENIFEDAINSLKHDPKLPPMEIAVLALGGYGRGEMCPLSDVDIMFLCPKRGGTSKKFRPWQEELTQRILYPLWDLGLKIGHSSRSTAEAIQEAKSDVHSRNALLESRFICGDRGLYTEFRKSYNKFVFAENPNQYIQDRLADQKARKAKYGNSAFLQEPDIKNGVGGLRDYQNLLWMAQIRLKLSSITDLVKAGYLREKEGQRLSEAHDFLLRVRNELHFQSSRATDLLDLDKQPEIALQMGYDDDDILQRVETFMRDYYQSAQTIDRTARMLEQRLAISSPTATRSPLSFRGVMGKSRKGRRFIIDGFVIVNGVITHETDTVFADDPHRLLRVFRHCQQLQCTFSFELTRLIQDSLDLLTAHLAGDPGIARTFRSILQVPGQVSPVLMLMHELGVLGRTLPEFDRLTCLVQHEYYHRYTADIHTLNTIVELDRIFTGENPNARAYLSQIRKTGNPSLLYLVLLLHDIGKGIAIKNHSETGARIADVIARRLGTPSNERKKVLKLITLHLEMARFWQRYDVDDPSTIRAFASRVEDPETLRYLFVLTYCDTLGTSSSLWNGYKDMLHNRLFSRTLDYLLTEGDHYSQDGQHQKQHLMEEFLSARRVELPGDEVEAHFNLLPENYFSHTYSSEIELHLNMVHQLLRKIAAADSMAALDPVIDWQDDIEQSQTVVTVVTWDRAGLFYKLAGAFSVAGLNIWSTKAISRSDHITIDTFYVSDSGGGPVQDPSARKTFEAEVRAALVDNVNHYPQISAKAKQARKSIFRNGRQLLKTPIQPVVEIYHELALQRTIVEVQANDRLGLLYLLAKSIFDQGFDISFARIATERGVALDTFYIESIDPTEDPTMPLIQLREQLETIVMLPDEG